uniref:Uncharacterized protein n=1 Tax=Romanomermis culicivorax TaxID=13658 RepID=A0A915IBY5_ROMCU
MFSTIFEGNELKTGTVIGSPQPSRLQVNHHRINVKNRRREIKLFIQCLITCLIYLIGTLIGYVGCYREEWFLWFEIFLYHCSILCQAECSIVYLILNSEIRKSLRQH